MSGATSSEPCPVDRNFEEVEDGLQEMGEVLPFREGPDDKRVSVWLRSKDAADPGVCTSFEPGLKRVGS